MIGPRNICVRTMMGELIPVEEILRDTSEWVDTAMMDYLDIPELWVDKLYEGYYGEDD